MEILEVEQKIDWNNLTFSITPTRSMYFATCDLGGEWEPGDLIPYGDFKISPAAGVLNYGQGVFEGTKAFKTLKGRDILFRPDRNAKRFIHSAERLCIPPVSEEMFLKAVEKTVRGENRPGQRTNITIANHLKIVISCNFTYGCNDCGSACTKNFIGK